MPLNPRQIVTWFLAAGGIAIAGGVAVAIATGQINDPSQLVVVLIGVANAALGYLVGIGAIPGPASEARPSPARRRPGPSPEEGVTATSTPFIMFVAKSVWVDVCYVRNGAEQSLGSVQYELPPGTDYNEVDTRLNELLPTIAAAQAQGQALPAHQPAPAGGASRPGTAPGRQTMSPRPGPGGHGRADVPPS